MAQFTVYKNKNPRSKTTYPLLVDAKADLLNELQTRLVIPLTKKPIARLRPSINIDGEQYLLMTPQLSGIARRSLASPLAASLISEARSSRRWSC